MDEIIAAECIPGSRQGRQTGLEELGGGPCMSEGGRGGQRAAQCILRFTFYAFTLPRAKKKGPLRIFTQGGPGGGRREEDGRHPFSLFSFFSLFSRL